MSLIGALAPAALAGPRQSDALVLAQVVRDTVASGIGRQVLHLRLCAMAARLRDGHPRRLLREALEPAIGPTRSRLFELPNGDIVAVAPPAAPHLRQAQSRLGILLGGLATDIDEEPPRCDLLDLPRDAVPLLAAIEEALSPTVPAAPPREDGASFGHGDLAALERALRGASLARFLRRRPIRRLVPGGEAESAWEEWRLPWAELLSALLPDADPARAPWLERRLRRILDQRLLTELTRAEEARRLAPAGLCLSAATIPDEAFLRLDGQLNDGQRERIVIALPAADALADPDGFAFARDLLKLRGYRMAIDLPDPTLLPCLAGEAAGADLIRLAWTDRLPATAPPLPLGREKVLLTGADRAAAIGWGWQVGITLFEGRLLRPRG